MQRTERPPLITESELLAGDLEIVGRIVNASNITLLAKTKPGDVMCVYKPQAGERPLWDFPVGTLCQREVAAWVVSEALGSSLVPPTVLREGPFGVGSVQAFIDADHDVDLNEFAASNEEQLAMLAVFDLIINNADRKGSHCLVDHAGQLWGIDHGVAFHAEPKHRSVIWAFQGTEIPGTTLELVSAFAARREATAKRLEALIATEEIDALYARTDQVLRRRRFPLLTDSQIPWPPW